MKSDHGVCGPLLSTSDRGPLSMMRTGRVCVPCDSLSEEKRLHAGVHCETLYVMALDDWDSEHGLTTSAYWQWGANVEELRAFFEFTSSTSNAAYEVVWDQAGQKIAGTGHDQYDVFATLMEDCLPVTNNWLLRASVIKDLVSFFEAYVEDAVGGALRETGGQELSEHAHWTKVTA
jgi:hypothetical protein